MRRVKLNISRFGLIASVLATVLQLPLITLAEDTPSTLQLQLQEIERQITADQLEIKQMQGQAKTLANKIATLTKQRALLQLQIQQTEVTLEDVENQLQDTRISLAESEQQTAVLHGRMESLLRHIYAADNQSFVYSVISSSDLFDVLNTAVAYGRLTSSLGQTVADSKEQTAKLKEQEVELAQQEEDASRLQVLRGLQRVAISSSVGEQNTLLKETKGQEAVYQAELGDHKAEAAAIRNRIYELLDTGNTHITFGEAVKIAQWVQSVTGIEPAFLLSVLTQESNLGSNVGTCNRASDPPSKHWTVVMKPTRDQAPFKAIMDKLGRSPEGTPISCPMRGKNGEQIGWGGAMGPAQFIPSTWIGYDSKITAITGKAADPWDIRDAFIAAALKLTNDGAASGTDQGEWNAAMRYFSGSTNTRFRFYGDQVMARTEEYRNDIKELEN